MENIQVVLLNVGFLTAALSLRQSKENGKRIIDWVAVVIPSAATITFFVIRTLG